MKKFKVGDKTISLQGSMAGTGHRCEVVGLPEKKTDKSILVKCQGTVVNPFWDSRDNHKKTNHKRTST